MAVLTVPPASGPCGHQLRGHTCQAAATGLQQSHSRRFIVSLTYAPPPANPQTKHPLRVCSLCSLLSPPTAATNPAQPSAIAASSGLAGFAGPRTGKCSNQVKSMVLLLLTSSRAITNLIASTIWQNLLPPASRGLNHRPRTPSNLNPDRQTRSAKAPRLHRPGSRPEPPD